MSLSSLSGVSIPIIYGTAWKKERTAELVVKAVLAGFRGIDTACQPKHYAEDQVGLALTTLQEKYGIDRKDLFIQTKFTSLDGQDPARIPYDKQAVLMDQVRQSFAKSLANLRTDYIDSLVMHGPMRTMADTVKVWRIFEEFHDEGKVKQLGISNIYDHQSFLQLYNEAKVKPKVIQNRFYRDSGYDVDTRKFCVEHGIVYQSFWTLTANPHALRDKTLQQYAAKRSITPEQAFFRFVMDLGITPLTGTTSDLHMKQDLAVVDLPSMNAEEIQAINNALF